MVFLKTPAYYQRERPGCGSAFGDGNVVRFRASMMFTVLLQGEDVVERAVENMGVSMGRLPPKQAPILHDSC